MQNTFNFDKVLITSGCSYTLRLNYLKSKLSQENKDFFNNTLLSDLGLPSGSIKHLKNTILLFVDYLLKNGIKSENIYIVGNLTQIGRIHYKFNKIEHKSILNFLETVNDKFPDCSIDDFKFRKYPFGFCELDGDIYSSLVNKTTFFNGLPNDIKKRILTFLDYHEKLSFEELVEDYFTDLFILQEFLKKHQIEYTLFFMNNIIEGWTFDYSSHKYNQSHGKYAVPDLNDTTNIKDINTAVNLIYNSIDFDNIVSYSTAKQKFGGIDEFAIENFKPTDFAGREDMEIKEYYGPHWDPFGHHPLENVQIEFEKKFIYPRMENFIKRNYGNQEN